MKPNLTKALFWKLLSLPLVGIFYWVVISAGFRVVSPVFAWRLSRAPGLSFLANSQELYRVDVGHLAAVFMLLAMFVLGVRNMRLFLAPAEPPDTPYWNNRNEAVVVRALGGVMLACEVVLFFMGLMDQGTSLWGGDGQNVALTIVATVYYVGQLCFIAYYTVFLQMR